MKLKSNEMYRFDVDVKKNSTSHFTIQYTKK